MRCNFSLTGLSYARVCVVAEVVKKCLDSTEQVDVKAMLLSLEENVQKVATRPVSTVTLQETSSDFVSTCVCIRQNSERQNNKIMEGQAFLEAEIERQIDT